jgi:hypothetical protein
MWERAARGEEALGEVGVGWGSAEARGIASLHRRHAHTVFSQTVREKEADSLENKIT